MLQMPRWGSVECVCVTDAAVGKCCVFVLQTQRWGSVVVWHGLYMYTYDTVLSVYSVRYKCDTE